MGAKLVKGRDTGQENTPDQQRTQESADLSAPQSGVAKGKDQVAFVEEVLAALLGDNAVRDGKVLQLLDSSNPNLTLDQSGLKAIHVAVVNKNLELLRRILGNRETDVNVRTAGLTPLHFAAQGISLEMVREMLKQPNVLINALTTEEKQTPLMIAIAADGPFTNEDKAALVKCLVEDPRCELDKADEDNWIALTYAAHYGNLPVGSVLLAGERAKLYTIDQLMNAYRQAVLGRHDDYCDLIMASLTLAQKKHIRDQVMKIKEMNGTTPLLRKLLHQAGSYLDNESVEEEPSGPAWDRQDQLLQPGSVIQLSNDKTLVQALQKDIKTGWRDGLDNVMGQRGLVKFIDSHGVLTIDFTYFGNANKRLRYVNPKAVDRLSQDDFNGTDADGNILHLGDTVRLIEDQGTLKSLTQATFVGDIASHIGYPGSLKYFNKDCFAVVVVAAKVWTLDSVALRKITYVLGSDDRPIQIGSIVEISPLKSLVERLQTPLYGGWNSIVLNALGKTGIVTNIGCECFISDGETPDCTVTVKCGTTELILNPRTVKLAGDKANVLPKSPSAAVAKQKTVPPVANRAESVIAGQDKISVSKESANPGNKACVLKKPDEKDQPLPPAVSPSSTAKLAENLEHHRQHHKEDEQLLLSKEKLQPGFVLNLEVEYDEPLQEAVKPPKTLARPKTGLLNAYIPFEQLTFLERIGKGGFAIVYRGRWNSTVCAVKVIKYDESEVAEFNQSVLDEVEFHRSLSHPHIVQFLGVSFNDADKLNLNAYLVLKFIDGFNLHQCIFDKKLVPNFTGEEKVKIAVEVCDAIRYLHEDANIIHQDIKPQNILIDRRRREALVTDFGISKIFSDPTLEGTIARYTQHACGTLPYMAPELATISEKVALFRRATPQSDIWSLAASLTELFTGQYIYGEAYPSQLTLLNHKASSELPMAIIGASGPVKAVLQSSLRNEPDLRPKSCKELLHLLEKNRKLLQIQELDSEA